MGLFPGKVHEFSSYPSVSAAAFCKAGSSPHSKNSYLPQAEEPVMKEEVTRRVEKVLNCMMMISTIYVDILGQFEIMSN